jgi:hypothetical protein
LRKDFEINAREMDFLWFSLMFQELLVESMTYEFPGRLIALLPMRGVNSINFIFNTRVSARAAVSQAVR